MYDDERKVDYPKYDDDCKALIEKFLTICLPVTTTPCVKVGKIKTECCGNPIVTPKKHERCCDEMKNDSCKFTIIQKMKIEIPLDFNADTKVDDLMVDCEFRHEKYDYDKYEKCNCDKHYYDKKYDDRKDDDKHDYDKKDDNKHDYDKKDCDKKDDDKHDYDKKDYDKKDDDKYDYDKKDYDKKDDDKHHYDKKDCDKHDYDKKDYDKKDWCMKDC